MRPILLAGQDYLAPKLPSGARLLAPPLAEKIIPDVRAAVLRALSSPLDGKPLEARVGERDRVLVVLDDPTFPVPPLRLDPRVLALDAVLSTLSKRGLPLRRVSLLCASGLNRRFRNVEVATVTGVAAAASHPTDCHDAEDAGNLADFGTTSAGEPVELNAALGRADLVITVSLVQTPLSSGAATLAGLGSMRTLRSVWSAKHLLAGAGPFEPEGALSQALQRVVETVEKKVPVLSLEIGLDARLTHNPHELSVDDAHELPRRLQAWNQLPRAIRERAMHASHGEYEVVSVFAGPTEAVRRKTLETLAPQVTVKAGAPADTVLLAVPSLVPHTLGAHENPVLTAASAFAWFLSWNAGQPLVRKGGALVLCASLHEHFDRKTHLPYVEFFERALAATRDPLELAAQFENDFATRPAYVEAYRERHAYPGAHPFQQWALGHVARQACGAVFAVGASTRVADRLGFVPVRDVEEGLARAKELAGPGLTVPLMPPVFRVHAG